MRGKLMCATGIRNWVSAVKIFRRQPRMFHYGCRCFIKPASISGRVRNFYIVCEFLLALRVHIIRSDIFVLDSM